MKKAPIQYSPNPSDLIAKFPRTQLKKGETVKIPVNFDSVLVYKDGTQELVQNIRSVTLEYPVESIFFVLNNRGVLKTKWGTPNRILVADIKGQAQMLGAFGRIEYSLQNPSKLIIKKMHSAERLIQSDLDQWVLELIPDAFNKYFATIQSLDIKDPAKLAIELKAKITPFLEALMDDLGLSLKSLTVENVNFDLPERTLS